MKHSIAVVLALLLGGCASAGNVALKDESATSVSSQIVEGKTTKNEVIAKYGQPTTTTFTDGGNQVWTYRYAYATANAVSFVPIVGLFAGGAHVKSKELVVMFDKKDVVAKFTMHETEQDVSRGASADAPSH